jgi:uncharacterized protein (TIGR03083 family)
MANANEPTFQAVVGALKREYTTLVNDIDAQPASFIEQDSFCANWKNYQVVSHLASGSELFQKSLETALDGREAVGDETRKAVWGYFDGLAPQAVYPEFKDRLGKLFAYLDALPADKHDAIVPTFAGVLPLPKALLTRLNEVALHVWDIQVKQDPSLKLSPDSAGLLLPMVVDRLPNRAKKDGLDKLGGKSIAFDIEGGASQFTLRPGEERGSVEHGLSSDAAVTVTMSAEAFERLVSGRLPIEQAVASGQATLSGSDGNTQVASALNEIFPGY